jgi:transposase-like protein
MATPRKRPEGKLKVGRPTDYRPEYCERVIELGRAGYSKAQMAREFDVARSTLDEWVKNFPEFSAAFMRAKDLALAEWEDKGAAGLELQGFNSSLYARIMSARFPDDYRDMRTTVLTGNNGGPIQIAAKELPASVNDFV